jgi:hypothetical protein
LHGACQLAEILKLHGIREIKKGEFCAKQHPLEQIVPTVISVVSQARQNLTLRAATHANLDFGLVLLTLNRRLLAIHGC